MRVRFLVLLVILLTATAPAATDAAGSTPRPFDSTGVIDSVSPDAALSNHDATPRPERVLDAIALLPVKATLGPADQTALRINEFMASNTAFIADPADGNYDDWFEIYNSGIQAVDLQGLYLTDDLSQPTTSGHQITQSIVIPAGGYALLWADDDAEQGPQHVGFKLSASGEDLAIFDADGSTLIDAYTFGPQSANISEGRFPDGAETWAFFDTPTPENPNLLSPPNIGGTARTPLLPSASDTVTVTAQITDNGALLTTTLYYSVDGGGFVAVSMNLVGSDLYAAQIPPQPDDSLVQYYVLAGDDDGQTVTDPRDAPGQSYVYQVGYQPPDLLINEFMALNTTTLEDPDRPGAFPDWIELYNPGPGAVDLGGKYLTDDLNDPTRFRITDSLVISPGSHLLFFADNDPEQGPLHTNFRLNVSGDSIGLFDSDIGGNQSLDSHSFGPQTADVSEGRCPDGGVGWYFITSPTPGATNVPCSSPPLITNVVHTPTLPSAIDTVTVTASITDDGLVTAATLLYSTGSGFTALPMAAQGGDSYSATIPAQTDGTWVSYYVLAEDNGGLSATDPRNAPTHTHRYLVGYQPPTVYLNEFMADNKGLVTDPQEADEYPDWIELHNPGPAPVDLGGLYLTDNLSEPTRFRIPNGISIPEGGFVLFWADNDPEQGPFHTSFALDANGEVLGLFGAEGTAQIDAVVFTTQTTNISYGRLPDGMGMWGLKDCATPGRSNADPHCILLPLMITGF